MSNNPVNHFRALLADIDFPTNDDISEDAYNVFLKGCDILLLYRGDARVLSRGLEVFMSTDVRPYVYAGAARIMALISYIRGNQYDRSGLDNADILFEQAQRYGNNRFEIDIIEPFLAAKRGFVDKTRILLNKLSKRPQARTSFLYALEELDHARMRQNVREVNRWATEALQRGTNDIHNLVVWSKQAAVLHDVGKTKEAIPLYEEVVKLDPQDAWTWHNLSLVYLKEGNSEQAGKCNFNALSIGQFGAAQSVLNTLVSQWTKNRQKDQLQEIPRYLSKTSNVPKAEADPPGLIDRLMGKT